MLAKKIRIILGSIALGLWTVYEVWALARNGLSEAGVALVAWLVIAAPVILYVLFVKRQLTSILSGLVLIGTRIWILVVLETNTSSTAGLILIPALFIDAFVIAASVTGDQVVIVLESRRARRRAPT